MLASPRDIGAAHDLVGGKAQETAVDLAMRSRLPVVRDPRRSLVDAVMSRDTPNQASANSRSSGLTGSKLAQ